MDLLIVGILVLLAILIPKLRKPFMYILGAVVIAVVVIRIRAGHAADLEKQQADAADQCVKQYQDAHPNPSSERTGLMEAMSHC